MKKISINSLTITSLILIIIISVFKFECSPIYQGATWTDTNTVFDMAYGMLNGKVPLKDTFDTKGPFMYFIYAIGVLISPTQYWGLWIVEVLLSIVSFFIIRSIYKEFSNFKGTKTGNNLINKFSDILAFLGWVLIYTSWPIHKGGSAEELAMPCILFLILVTVRIFGESGHCKREEILIVGVLFALVFWIKYSLVLAFGIFFVIYGISLLVGQKFSKFGQVLGLSIGGFAIGSVPVFLYYLFTGALGNLFHNYFYVNLNLYNFFNSQYNSAYPDMSFGARMQFWMDNISAGVSESFPMAILGILLLIASYFLFNKRLLVTVLLIEGLVGLGGEYWTIRWLYYFAIILPFIICLLQLVAVNLIKLTPKNKRSIYSNVPTQFASLALIFLIAVPLVIGGIAGEGTKLTGDIGGDGRQLASAPKQSQNLAADKMHELSASPTALVYGYIDSGYLYRAGIVPSHYFFDRPQFFYNNYPDIDDQQLEYIKNKQQEFVIANGNTLGYNIGSVKAEVNEQFSYTDKVTGQQMKVDIPKVLKENYDFVEGYTTTDPDHAPWMLWKVKK